MTAPSVRAFLAAILVSLLAACQLPPAGPDYPPVTIGPGRVPSPPPPPPPPVPHIQYTKFLAFGDSLTEGQDIPGIFVYDPGVSVGYPFKLLGLLSARYTDQLIQMANYGLGGQKATDPAELNRLRDRLNETRPDVTILLEGVNDLNSGKGLNETVDAVRNLVLVAKAAGSQVVVSTLPTQTRFAGSAAETPAYNAGLTAMALANGAAVADIYPVIAVADLFDGLHPTAAGNAKIAQVYFDRLKQLYELPTTTLGRSP